MYAKVNLEVETRENVLVVPKVALVDSEGQRGVYQANDENRARFKPVKVGLEDNDRAEILDGLSEGERSSRPAPARCAATTSWRSPGRAVRRVQVAASLAWAARAGRGGPRWPRPSAGRSGRNRRKPTAAAPRRGEPVAGATGRP